MLRTPFLIFAFFLLCPKDSYPKILQNIKGELLKSRAAGNYWNKHPLVTTLQFLKKEKKKKASEQLCFMLMVKTPNLKKDLVL